MESPRDKNDDWTRTSFEGHGDALILKDDLAKLLALLDPSSWGDDRSCHISHGGRRVIQGDGAEPAVRAPHELRHAGQDGSLQGKGHMQVKMGKDEQVPYWFKGVRYDTLDGLLGACNTSTSQTHPRIGDLTGISAGVVREDMHGLFRKYAGSQRGVTMHQFKGLATSLAAELGVDPVRFGDLSILFHRFDFSCDGIIDEEECSALVESMLRHYRDAYCPGTATQALMLDLEFKSLEEHYVLAQKLGQGGQGAVYLARSKSSGDRRVVKCFDKRNRNAPVEDIKNEFQLLRSLDHPRIQRLYDIFEDRGNVYVVSEPYLGGDLRHLTENAMDAGVSVTSKWLAKILYQVLQGVCYLHKTRVLHCDLKESNVMVSTNDSWVNPSVVVIDFGLARHFLVGGGSGGTPGYMPPEVWIQGLWTARGDVHALGVVIFQLFAMEHRCYGGLTDEEIMKATVNQEPNFQEIRRYWRRCEDVIKLLKTMLMKDFRQRPTVSTCMEHNFFKDRVFSDQENADLIPEDICTAMLSLSEKGQRSDLHRAILSDMASRLNLAQMQSLAEAFAAIDADQDGLISMKEAREALLKDGLLESQDVERIIEALLGCSDHVPYSTFMGLMLAERNAGSDENRLLRSEFKELDIDGTGYLDVHEIRKLLNRPALTQIRLGRSPESLMALMDVDSDGRVSFEEFKAVCCCRGAHR